MRYLIMLALLSSVLLGATNNITFQGTIDNPNGTPYQGAITTGVKFFTQADGGTEWQDFAPDNRVSSFTVSRGTYTIAISLNNTQIDWLVENNNPNTAPNEGYFMEVYVATGNNVPSNILFTDTYKLSPRVQVLAVPMAFTSRGIYLNHTTKSLHINAAGYTEGGRPPNGMVSTGKVGIGTPDTKGFNLRVVASTIPGNSDGDLNSNAVTTASDKRAIHIVGTDTNRTFLNAAGVISANRVYNARWQ